MEPGPPRCASFTKAIPSGKKVKLSGTDPFNNIVLPLTKALDHAISSRRLSSLFKQLLPSLTLCVSVLDAPMLLVDDPANPGAPILTPWVRIIRREANADKQRKRSGWYRFYVVDAVHAGFLEEYVANHVMPFYSSFQDVMIRKGLIFSKGGEVDSLSDFAWPDVRPLPAQG